jgi:cobalt/nickel transport protein
MRCVTLVLLLLTLLPAAAPAAIGVLLPSDDVVGPGDSAVVTVGARLYDPLQRRFEAAGKPQRLGVQFLGEETSLLAAGKPAGDTAAAGWVAPQAIKRPGDYTFFAELAPQWHAAEEQFFIHAAKLCVNAVGLEEGWDEPVGLDAEIVPMSRPYGQGPGSLFSGQVLLKGEPAPYAMIEIVALGPNPDNPPPGPLPAAPYLSQKVRADADGVFHAAMPRPGWWGFAATLDVERTILHEGADMPVSLVSSFWVLTRDP